MDMPNTGVAGECFSESLLQNIQRGNNSKVLSIIQNTNLCFVTDSSGASLLHYAAKYGNVWLVKYLIDLGAYVDVQNNLKETPLMLAVEGNQIETIKLLFSANANIFVPDLNSRCALKKAYDNKTKIMIDCGNILEIDKLQMSENIVEEFEKHATRQCLNNSIHVQSKAFLANCPLYLFIALKNADVTRVLLEKGSPVDVKEPETGKTSLHIAVANSDLENVKVLLDYGADANVKNNKGDTPIVSLMYFADEDIILKIFEVLMAAGANLIDRDSGIICVRFLLFYGDKEIISSLLKYKIDLSFVDECGHTALHYLAQNPNDVLAELRDLKIDINCRMEDTNESILHMAVKKGNVSSVKFLIDREADIEAMCSLGFTPVSCVIPHHHSCYERLDVNKECIEILLSHGANPQILTEENQDNFLRVFDEPIADTLIQLMKPILAHLSLMEMMGRQIRPTMENFIQSISKFKNFSQLTKVECKEMKQIELGKTFTMFDLLVASDRQISLYARNRRLTSIFNNAKKNCTLDSSYQRKFKKNIVKFNHLSELRKRAATTIDEILSKVYNISVYIIAQKIVDFLEDHELSILIESQVLLTT